MVKLVAETSTNSAKMTENMDLRAFMGYSNMLRYDFSQKMVVTGFWGRFVGLWMKVVYRQVTVL